MSFIRPHIRATAYIVIYNRKSDRWELISWYFRFYATTAILAILFTSRNKIWYCAEKKEYSSAITYSIQWLCSSSYSYRSCRNFSKHFYYLRYFLLESIVGTRIFYYNRELFQFLTSAKMVEIRYLLLKFLSASQYTSMCIERKTWQPPYVTVEQIVFLFRPTEYSQVTNKG